MDEITPVETDWPQLAVPDKPYVETVITVKVTSRMTIEDYIKNNGHSSDKPVTEMIAECHDHLSDPGDMYEAVVQAINWGTTEYTGIEGDYKVEFKVPVKQEPLPGI